jgi:glycosyltransferase involved in cell wall biosynthesis
MNELKEHGFNKVSFLPHGVDISVFNPSFKSGEWKKKIGIDGKIALLYAGRLVWEKDLKVLVETYKIITSLRNDIKFVLAGDGPIRNELEQLMPEAVFLGHMNGKDLSEAYASSDVFVFPSTTETFGNVTVEAMASGLPPVCAKEGGAYGIIQEGLTGLLAEPRNPNDLAEKIIFLSDNEDARIRMAHKALEFANEQTWDNIFRKLYNSYNEVIFNYRLNGKRKRRSAA